MDGEDDDHRGVHATRGYRQKRSCDSHCQTGSCPYRGYGPNCYGMCGRGVHASPGSVVIAACTKDALAMTTVVGHTATSVGHA